jgi:hypothetical protein
MKIGDLKRQLLSSAVIASNEAVKPQQNEKESISDRIYIAMALKDFDRRHRLRSNLHAG